MKEKVLEEVQKNRTFLIPFWPLKCLKAISYKSDLANPYNPKICTDCPTFFVNKRDQILSQSN